MFLKAALVPVTNRLLDSLSPATRNRILAVGRHVPLPVRETLIEPGEAIRYAYFQTSGITSVVIELMDGGSAEVALIGREGLVGALHLLGPAVSPARCFVQVDGDGYRVPFAEMRVLFLESEEFRGRVLELVQQQILTASQLVACNRLHETEARLARWLLMVQDRVQADTLNLTQEFLAQMLGTQRTTVVMAAGAFQRSGLITYSRGRITILSRELLVEAACDCSKVIHQHYADLYQKPMAANGKHDGRSTRSPRPVEAG